MFIKTEDGDIRSYKKIKKVHEKTNYKLEDNIIYTCRNAGKLDADVKKNIQRV